MKKNIYIVLIGLLSVFGMVSCDNSSEDVFDQPASERLKASIQTYQTALKSAENGWVFQYFPHKEKKYGGYNFYVKFTNNDSVSVSFNAKTSIESLYDVIPYGGPVLSFTTYNGLMHYFSNPSSKEYQAKGGDNEFLIMSQEGDVINLKGVHSTNDARLIKLNGTALEYKTKADEVEKFIKGVAMGAKVGTTDVEILLAGRHLTFKYNDGEKDVSTKIAFIYTDKGIRLYEPIAIGEVKAQEFILDKEAKALNAVNGKMTILLAFAPYNYDQEWYFEVKDNLVSASFITMFQQFKEKYKKTILATKYKLALADKVYWGTTLSKDTRPGLTFLIGKYKGVYHLNFGGVVGQPDQVKVSLNGAGLNWSFFGTAPVAMMNKMMSNSPYKVELDDAKNPTTVKYISTKDKDFWFILKK